MGVRRHDELKVEHGAPICSDLPSGRMCRTTFCYGTHDEHFGLQTCYFYGQKGTCPSGNDVFGAVVSSLRAIARAKCYGVPLIPVNDYTFDILSPNKRTFRLLDDETYQRCDPFSELMLRTNKLDETLQFWDTIMKVMIISKTDNDFSLFFGGHKPRLKYVQHHGLITLSPGHLCYVCPKAQLKMLSKSVLKFCKNSVVQPFCRVDYEGRESDYLLILKDPNDYPMYIFDEESFSRFSSIDPKSTAKWTLSMMKEFGPSLNLDDS